MHFILLKVLNSFLKAANFYFFLSSFKLPSKNLNLYRTNMTDRITLANGLGFTYFWTNVTQYWSTSIEALSISKFKQFSFSRKEQIHVLETRSTRIIRRQNHDISWLIGNYSRKYSSWYTCCTISMYLTYSYINKWTVT